MNLAEQSRTLLASLDLCVARVLSTPPAERGDALVQLRELHVEVATGAGYGRSEAHDLAVIMDGWTRALFEIAAAGGNWRGDSA